MSTGKWKPGCLPEWEKADLPEPLPFTFRNTLRTIGPGAILLVGAIGMGEWVAGPMMAVQHGREILWIATISIVLQSLLNLESVRYTIATGEPILTGIMRLRPGAGVWGVFYTVGALAQLGGPAAAAGCAAVGFAAIAGHVAGEVDKTILVMVTCGVVLATALLLACGRRHRARA